jgi:hypothetical protein
MKGEMFSGRNTPGVCNHGDKRTIATFVQVKETVKGVFVQAMKAYRKVKACLSSFLNSALG